MGPDALERLVNVCIKELHTDPSLRLVDASNVHKSVHAEVAILKSPVYLRLAQVLGGQSTALLQGLARGVTMQSQFAPQLSQQPSLQASCQAQVQPQLQANVMGQSLPAGRSLVLPLKRAAPSDVQPAASGPNDTSITGQWTDLQAPTGQLSEPKSATLRLTQASKAPAKPLIPGGPCENPFCGVIEAPQWRRIEKKLVCNRCGMYYHRHARFPDWTYFDGLANRQALRQGVVMHRTRLPDSPTHASTSPAGAAAATSGDTYTPNSAPASAGPCPKHQPQQPPSPQHPPQAQQPSDHAGGTGVSTPSSPGFPGGTTVAVETPLLRALRQLSSSRPSAANPAPPDHPASVMRAVTAAVRGPPAAPNPVANQVDTDALLLRVLHAQSQLQAQSNAQLQLQALLGARLAGPQQHLEQLQLMLLYEQLKLHKQQQQHEKEEQKQTQLIQPTGSVPESPASDSTFTPWAAREGCGATGGGVISAFVGAPGGPAQPQANPPQQPHPQARPRSGCTGDTGPPPWAVDSRGSGIGDTAQRRRSGGGSRDDGVTSQGRTVVAGSEVSAAGRPGALLEQQQSRRQPPHPVEEMLARRHVPQAAAVAAGAPLETAQGDAAAVPGGRLRSLREGKGTHDCAGSGSETAVADGPEPPALKRQRVPATLASLSSVMESSEPSGAPRPDQQLLLLQQLMTQRLNGQSQQQPQLLLQQQQEACRVLLASSQQQQPQSVPDQGSLLLSPVLAAMLQQDKAVRAAQQAATAASGHEQLQAQMQTKIHERLETQVHGAQQRSAMHHAMEAEQQRQRKHGQDWEREREEAVARLGRAGPSLMDTVTVAASLQTKQPGEILLQQQQQQRQQRILQHQATLGGNGGGQSLGYEGCASAGAVGGLLMRDLQQRAMFAQQQQQQQPQQQSQVFIRRRSFAGAGAFGTSGSAVADRYSRAAEMAPADAAVHFSGGALAGVACDVQPVLPEKQANCVAPPLGGTTQQAPYGTVMAGPSSARCPSSSVDVNILDMLLAQGATKAAVAAHLEAALNGGFTHLGGGFTHLGGTVAGSGGGLRHGFAGGAGMMMLPVLDLGKPSTAVAF